MTSKNILLLPDVLVEEQATLMAKSGSVFLDSFPYDLGLTNRRVLL
jgi:hypothetical protein